MEAATYPVEQREVAAYVTREVAMNIVRSAGITPDGRGRYLDNETGEPLAFQLDEALMVALGRIGA